MAIVYYPKADVILKRDTISASYEQVVLSNNPNTILFFDSASNLSVLSSSIFYLTSSWAVTASYALNGGGTGTSIIQKSYKFDSDFGVLTPLNTASFFVSNDNYTLTKIRLQINGSGSCDVNLYKNDASSHLSSSYALSSSNDFDWVTLTALQSASYVINDTTKIVYTNPSGYILNIMVDAEYTK